MSVQISERSFEEAIECALLAHGPDAFPADDPRVSETPPPYGESPRAAIFGATPRNTTASAACSHVRCSISSTPPNRRNGRSSNSITASR